jgi:predicted RNA-binding Zn ribbon-like protein
VIFPKEKDDVALAVALMNTWDELEDDPEVLRDETYVQRILDWYGLPLAATADDVVPLRRIRDRLRRAFETDEAGAVAELNGVLRSAGAVPQLERSKGGWAFNYGPRRPSVPALLAGRSAVGLLEVVRAGDWGRTGFCAASPCRCVFVDRSRNRSRRYCCWLCADRATQAAARARRKAKA